MNLIESRNLATILGLCPDSDAWLFERAGFSASGYICQDNLDAQHFFRQF